VLRFEEQNESRRLGTYRNKTIVIWLTAITKSTSKCFGARHYNSIPQKVLVKIFQLFFPTIPIAIGPTGQGTGLGLSLSYDIVKAHGVELKVETKNGEGSQFIIMLPLV